MAVIKITVFQKDLHKAVSSQDRQKISQSKAQFLLLPEGFPHFFQSDTPQKAASHEKEYIDHILEISESFPGVILGGSFIRETEEKKFVHSVPIISSVVLVDTYDKKNLSPAEKGSLSTGKSESIFIMGGLRFGILVGEDIEDNTLWKEFQDEDIEILFHLDSSHTNRSYEEDLKYYETISKEKKIHLIRVCGIQENKPARSLYSSPSGINWKVGKGEETSELLKTLSVNVQRSYFL